MWRGVEKTCAARDPAVVAVAFSADGRRLLSGGWDHAIHAFDLDLPRRYREAAPRLRAAQAALARDPADAAALTTLGEWLALRRHWAWAVELLERARRSGGDGVPSLALARCYWMAGRGADAAREFERAAARGEAPNKYLVLCARVARAEGKATAAGPRGR